MRLAFKKILSNNSHVWIMLILGLSLVARLWQYRPHMPMWDASAYLMMGKYLFSSGQEGFLEPFRPLAWPLVLGFVGWVGLDPLWMGYILGILFSLGSLVLVYAIARELFDARTGLLACVLLAMSPSLFFWGNCLYSEIPACFTGLLGFYLYVRKRDFWAGFWLSISFFTKFTQIILLVFVGLAIVIDAIRSKKYSRLNKFLAGATGILVIFLIVQQGLYGDALFPFLQGKSVYGQVTYFWFDGMIRALLEIMKVEHAALTLAPVGVWYACRGKTRRQEVVVLSLMAVCSFLWIGKLPTSIVRYAVLALPYAYILSAVGLLRFVESVTEKHIAVRVVTAVVLMSLFPLYKIGTVKFSSDQPDFVQSYAVKNEAMLKGKRIWISSPQELVTTSLKADQLMYYPIFDFRRVQELSGQLRKADVVFFDSASLVCAPPEDSNCLAKKNELFQNIERDFKLIHEQKNARGQLRGIYQKKQ